MLQRGACYLRVSTNDQLEFSPDAQLRAIKTYAKNNNIIIDDDYVFIDEGISGRKADKRPAFQEMIKIAKSKPKKFDVILVHKFDRFARSREDSVVYKSLLRKECGIKVVSITESIEDDKFSVILEAMLEAMAEYYSLNLSDEVKKGMTEKARRGQFQSSPPFGYEMKNKELSIIEDEAKAVKLIFDKFLYEDKGFLAIAKYINSLGYKTHRGNPFENRTIEYILNNPIYCGKVRWTPTGKIRRDYNNENSIIKKSTHEPIISEEVFEKTKTKLEKRKEINRKFYKGSNPQNLHWLNGLVRCSECGKTLVKNQNKYYQCNGYVKGQCTTSQFIRISEIETAILNQIKKDFTSRLILNVKINSNNFNNEEQQIIYTQLEKLKEKASRIKEAYINGIDSLSEYKNNKQELAEQKSFLEEKLKDMENSNIIKPKDAIVKENLKTVYEILTDNNIDMQRKYDISHLLIEKIEFSKPAHRLTLEYKLYQME
ncbi:MAG: recombinase family protein [Acutalibacteraceae bacterium]|nr:recombinase family protein [Acutalibacteraceae bacterium]